MTYSIKALLLSALIFPGLGQLLLKHYRTGFTMVAVAFACVATVVHQAFNKVLSIAEQMQNDGVSVDSAQMTEYLENAMAHYDSTLINLAMAGLILCWLVSVVHAYLAGKAMDNENKTRMNPDERE